MQRTKTNKPNPSAILTADWHLREDVPVCRTDDFWETQWRKVDFIIELANKYNSLPIYHAGDLFDYWKPSPMLLSEILKRLNYCDFYTVYGNHDLPQHNIELQHKSGINCLFQAGKLEIRKTFQERDFSNEPLELCHWNETPLQNKISKVLLWHVMTYQGKEPWPGCPAPSGAKLLRKYPQYDLIVTGDNHRPFVEEHEGRLLVNPGSIFRMTADQVDHQPRVYLWYAETNTVEAVYLPIEDNVISREHLEIKEKRDNRIEAFVSQLNGDWSAGLSFEDNLKQFETKNQVRQSVMDLVYKAIEV